MKTAFIFDTIIYTSNNEEFYARTLNYDLWKSRYLYFFSNIKVVTRCKSDSKNDIKNKYKLVNGENVSVTPIYQYNNVLDYYLKKKVIFDQLYSQLKDMDLVIVRLPSILGNISIDICKQYNIPYIVEVVADAWDSYFFHTNVLGKFLAPIMHYKTKKRVLSSDNVLYVTSEYLQKRYPTKGTNIIGVSDVVLDTENELSDHSFEKNTLRRLSNIKSKKVTIGIVGNYNLKTKGQHIAIKALSKLTNVEYNLELVGNGNKEYLRKLGNSKKVNISFIGALKSGEDMNKWYDQLDILLVPSFQEGLPRVIVEAMSRGVLIIGSNAGGITELLPKELIFRRGNYSQLYLILKDLFKNKIDVKEILNNNKIIVSEFESQKLEVQRSLFYKNALRSIN